MQPERCQRKVGACPEIQGKTAAAEQLFKFLSYVSNC